MAAWVFSVFPTRRTDIPMILYKSLVCCHLKYYTVLVYGIHLKYQISRFQNLDSIQRTFTSKIAGLKDLHYWERLEKLSLLYLQIRHGLTSNELQIIFVNNNHRGTISKVPLLQRGCKMRHRSLLENSFAIMGPRIWNCIPGHIRKWDTLDLFIRQLTTFVLKVLDKPQIR